jgi:acyl-coenzyme A synthetase/AMP-(fatty) acid ligase
MEKFDLDAWHDLIVEHRPRFANIPPSRLGALLERNWPKEHLSSLLALRTGAAPLDHDLAVRFEERYGIPVLEGYGATEFAGGVAGWTIRDHREFSKTKRQSVGRANPGVELRVIDADTQEPLRPGEQGILEVRTKQIGEGKDWVRTTDIAHIDEDGFLYIHGRADNAINRGGFKVHPASVEDALRKLHGVRDACVVGISDAELGQVPVAAIELHSGASAPDVDEVKASLRTQLKPYEIPARFLWLEELPRTPSMKASQARVRELFLEGAS